LLINFILQPPLTLFVLLLSILTILLEIAYLLPILYRSWLQKSRVEHYFRLKPPTALLLAPWLTILLIVLVGLFVIFGQNFISCQSGGFFYARYACPCSS